VMVGEVGVRGFLRTLLQNETLETLG